MSDSKEKHDGILWPQPIERRDEHGAHPPGEERLTSPGPTEYQGKTHRQIYAIMMARKTRRKPCYNDAARAWQTLGYIGKKGSRGPLKPEWDWFRVHMNNLWGFLNHRYSRHREMRVAILDALRALGIRNPRWSVSFRLERATDMRGYEGLFDLTREVPKEPKKPGNRAVGLIIAESRAAASGSSTSTPKEPSAKDGWDKVPDPPRAIYKDARTAAPRDGSDAALFAAHVMKPRPDMRTGLEPDMKQIALRDMDVWQRYHRYQGFQALDQDNNAVEFRAVPMPQGPESLWHAVSYFRSGKRNPSGPATSLPRYIFSHADIKASLFSYYLGVLLDSTHVRYRDYHSMQHYSEFSTLPGYGNPDILRFLTSGREQGRAAYLHDRSFLHVIADFFGTQVVVFYPDPTSSLPGNACAPAWLATEPEFRKAKGDPEVIDLSTFDAAKHTVQCRGPIWPQDDQLAYKYVPVVYGHYTDSARQILLATDDWQHFDPVELVAPGWGEGSTHHHTAEGYGREFARTTQTMPARFNVADRGIVGAGREWWNRHEAGQDMEDGCPPVVLHLDPVPDAMPHYKAGTQAELEALGVDKRAMLHMEGDSALFRFRNGYEVELERFDMVHSALDMLMWKTWQHEGERVVHESLGEDGWLCSRGVWPSTGNVVMDNPEELYAGGEVEKGWRR